MSFDLRDAEDKITSLERDLDDLRGYLEKLTRLVKAIDLAVPGYRAASAIPSRPPRYNPCERPSKMSQQ